MCSLKMNKTIVKAEDYLDLEQLTESLELNLKVYALKHPDFSCVIEQDLDNTRLIVKTLYLEEHAN